MNLLKIVRECKILLHSSRLLINYLLQERKKKGKPKVYVRTMKVEGLIIKSKT